MEDDGGDDGWQPDEDTVKVFTMIRNRIALLRAHAVQERAYALAKGEDIAGLGTEAEPVICGATTNTVETRYKPHLFGIYGVKGLVDGSPTAKGLFTKGNGEKQMTDDMVMPLNTLKEFKNDVSSQWNGKARPGTMRHKIQGHFSTNDNGWFRSSVNKLFEFFPEKCPEDGKSYYKTWVQLANENPSGLLPAYFTDEKFSHKAKAGTASETGTKRAAQGGPKERKKPKKPREPKKPKNKAKKQPSGSDADSEPEAQETDDDRDDSDGDDGDGGGGGGGDNAVGSTSARQSGRLKRAAAMSGQLRASKIAQREGNQDEEKKKKEKAKRALERKEDRKHARDAPEHMSEYEVQKLHTMWQNAEHMRSLDLGDNAAAECERLKEKWQKADKQLKREEAGRASFKGLGPIFWEGGERVRYFERDADLDKMNAVEVAAYLKTTQQYCYLYPAMMPADPVEEPAKEAEAEKAEKAEEEEEEEEDSDDDDDDWEDGGGGEAAAAAAKKAKPARPNDLLDIRESPVPSGKSSPPKDDTTWLHDQEKVMAKLRKDAAKAKAKEEEDRMVEYQKKLILALQETQLHRAELAERKTVRDGNKKITYTSASWRGTKKHPSCGSPAAYVRKYGAKGILIPEPECVAQIREDWDKIEATKRSSAPGARVPCPTREYKTKYDARAYMFLPEDGRGHGTVAFKGPTNYPHKTLQWIGIAQNNWIRTFLWCGENGYETQFITRARFKELDKVRRAELKKAKEAQPKDPKMRGRKGI